MGADRHGSWRACACRCRPNTCGEVLRRAVALAAARFAAALPWVAQMIAASQQQGRSRWVALPPRWRARIRSGGRLKVQRALQGPLPREPNRRGSRPRPGHTSCVVPYRNAVLGTRAQSTRRRAHPGHAPPFIVPTGSPRRTAAAWDTGLSPACSRHVMRPGVRRPHVVARRGVGPAGRCAGDTAGFAGSRSASCGPAPSQCAGVATPVRHAHAWKVGSMHRPCACTGKRPLHPNRFWLPAAQRSPRSDEQTTRRPHRTLSCPTSMARRCPRPDIARSIDLLAPCMRRRSRSCCPVARRWVSLRITARGRGWRPRWRSLRWSASSSRACVAEPVPKAHA